MNNFYLGIDVSKGYADFIIINHSKKPVMKRFQLDDSFDGHSQLYQIIKSFCNQNPGCRIMAGVESSGGYENNWYQTLFNFQNFFDLRVAHLNPLAVCHSRSADLKRTITDAVSAISIAEYLISHPEKVTYQKQLNPLQSHSKQLGFIIMLEKQYTLFRNQFESIIYGANPTIMAYCKDGMPEWVLKLLIKFPTAKQLSRVKPHTVAKIPYITKERALELISDAKNSIASSTDDMTGDLIKAYAQQMLNLKSTIKIQKKALEKSCDIPEVKLLQTVNGIGAFSAVALMIYIQNVERFPSAKKISAFFGLHPVFKQSGDGTSRIQMSKQGQKNVRRILFMVTLNAIQSNPLIREIYESKVSGGMEKMAAIGLCMHKLLRIIYGMLKTNKPFDPEIDRCNRQKSIEADKGIKEDKNRRLQDYDPKAPISRRQYLKRVERKKSQSDNITKCRIIASVPETT